MINRTVQVFRFASLRNLTIAGSAIRQLDTDAGLFFDHRPPTSKLLQETSTLLPDTCSESL